MAERFQYHPLQSDEIRVPGINPLKPGEGDSTPINMDLKHINMPGQAARSSPWALSYLWVSTENQQMAQINGMIKKRHEPNFAFNFFSPQNILTPLITLSQVLECMQTFKFITNPL